MARRPKTGYANEEIPDHVPPANQGAIPVVVRLVDDENGEHYRPAEARRWNRTHVMVALRDVHPDTGRRCDTLAWLHAEDVHRVLQADDVRGRANDDPDRRVQVRSDLPRDSRS